MPRGAKKYKERGTPAAQQARALAAHGGPTTPTTVMRGQKRQRIGEGRRRGGGCKATWLPESGDQEYWVRSYLALNECLEMLWAEKEDTGGGDGGGEASQGAGLGAGGGRRKFYSKQKAMNDVDGSRGAGGEEEVGDEVFELDLFTEYDARSRIANIAAFRDVEA
jgi:hypothetical protein